MGKHCVTGLWLSLTVAFTAGIIFAMLSPVWFHNKKHFRVNATSPSALSFNVLTFGLFRYCRHDELKDVIVDCQYFKNFREIPSIAWILSAVICSMGAGLFVLSILLATFGMCINMEKEERLRICIAYIQTIAVGLLSIAILMFPLGLDSEFARDVCGEDTSMYMSGNCHVAWGYMLGIMTISMTVFLPILAKYSTEIDYDDDDGSSYLDDDFKTDTVFLTASSKVMTTV